MKLSTPSSRTKPCHPSCQGGGGVGVGERFPHRLRDSKSSSCIKPASESQSDSRKKDGVFPSWCAPKHAIEEKCQPPIHPKYASGHRPPRDFPRTLGERRILYEGESSTAPFEEATGENSGHLRIVEVVDRGSLFHAKDEFQSFSSSPMFGTTHSCKSSSWPSSDESLPVGVTDGDACAGRGGES